MKTTIVFIILFLFLVCPQYGFSTVYSTETELATSIPIASGSPYVHTPVYSIGPLNLSAGQVVDLRLRAEVTNPCPGNVMLGRYIVRSNSPTSISGQMVAYQAGSNITPAEHHSIVVIPLLDPITEDLEGVYYNVVMYAASSNTTCQRVFLKVEGGAGGYSVFQIEVR